jgi:hypothetical protein
VLTSEVVNGPYLGWSMPRLRSLLRRPSAPMIVALLALFVALGGPAEAKRMLLGSKQVRNHSLKVHDLRKSAVRSLRRTPDGSITEAKIRNGAVTPGKLARGAVGTHAIADRSVASGDISLGAVGSLEVADGSLGGADIADGSLDSRDIGRFWGRFTVTLGSRPGQSAQPIGPGACWRGDPVGLAPERAHANIAEDVIVVTPGAGWPDRDPPAGATFFARASSTPGRFTLTVCNAPASGTAINPVAVAFNYVVVDVP